MGLRAAERQGAANGEIARPGARWQVRYGMIGEERGGEATLSLEGKTALVTGAARGQGRAHAVRLAHDGADLVLLDMVAPIPTVDYPLPEPRDLEETAQLVRKEGRRVLARQADVRVAADLHDVVSEALGEFGRLDILVANAGITNGNRPFYEFSEEQWDVLMDVNLKGTWLTCAAVVPQMIERKQGGAIVLTASGAGLRAAPNIANYNVSKHGVVGLMKTMANELAQHYIRVNAICPSTVDTPMIQNESLYRAFRPDLPDPGKEEAAAAFRTMNPIPEPWLDPEDIAAAAAWLVSDDARFVTGVALPVDLGLNNKFL